MPKFKLRQLTKIEFPLWNKLVDESIRGTIFHKSYWLEASGMNFVIYGSFKGNELYAGIPLCYKKGFGLKTVSQPPLTPYLGVLFNKQDAKYVNILSEEKEVLRKIALKLKNDFDFISFQFPPSSVDLQPFVWEGFSAGVRYTYIINLGKDLNDIWNDMSFKTRNHIRKAGKDGITVVRGNNFNLTLDLVEKTFARQNKEASFKPIASNYNEVLKERNQCMPFLAIDKDGRAIAAVYIVWDKKTSYQLLAGYDSKQVHSGATAFAIWEAIQFSKKELGLGQYDFEGSMLPRVEQFFRKFGGRQTPYYTVTWIKPSLKILFFGRKVVGSILNKLRLF